MPFGRCRGDFVARPLHALTCCTRGTAPKAETEVSGSKAMNLSSGQLSNKAKLTCLPYRGQHRELA
eukprot:9331812-Pyramimonas_sp.AAC.1